jgi:hypothetical protein
MDKGIEHPLRGEHISRINHVMDQIGANLDGDLSLRKLAAASHFPPEERSDQTYSLGICVSGQIL